MESARSYTSSDVTTTRFSITEYQGTTFGTLLTSDESEDNSLMTADGQTTDAENAESTDGSKLYTLEDWKNSLSLRTGRVSMRATSAENTASKLHEEMIRYIYELLFGGARDRLRDTMKELEQSGQDSLSSSSVTATTVTSTMYTSTFHSESESTSFSTMGTVVTSDGREINFNVEIGMSRAFQEAYEGSQTIKSVVLCDPLVINLDTDVTELSDQKFYFDIDADGEEDEISQLGSGSGYLALDRNEDGTINDGSELFGTSSGDGFSDLAQYDEDGNGWIDEADSVWNQLKIWCREEDGTDTLYTLADKGVGAICLQRVGTDFTLQSGSGDTNGQIRSTGIFLYENGAAGTIQHVDVAKYEEAI